MFILLSPSKTIDFKGAAQTEIFSVPTYLSHSKKLAEILKKYTARRLSNLMHINPKLAQLNFERYQEWETPFNKNNAEEAILTFKGEVYSGLNAADLNKEDLKFAQEKLRILSGLYGLLKPLDLIKPYRLEMGTKLKGRGWKNLYTFWREILTQSLKIQMKETEDDILVNLASTEYADAIDFKKLNCRVITPNFKDFHKGEYKFMTAYGKKARGMMTRYIITNKLNDPDEMKLFEEEGYYYNDNLSEGDNWIFTRG